MCARASARFWEFFPGVDAVPSQFLCRYFMGPLPISYSNRNGRGGPVHFLSFLLSLY